MQPSRWEGITGGGDDRPITLVGLLLAGRLRTVVQDVSVSPYLATLSAAIPGTEGGDLALEEDNEADLLPVSADSPTPHLDKLRELLNNHKLPDADRASVESALERHADWVRAMDAVSETEDAQVIRLVELLNEYKRSVELDLIWDSEADFLFRQRGQLKLDNSILEEFLPRLVDPAVIPSLSGKSYSRGPNTTFAAAYFVTSLAEPAKGGGLQIRSKAQDFAVSRDTFLRASNSDSFPLGDTVTHRVHVAFLAAECKTNLDKTMFQEAIATAHDLKVAVPGARYFLICEWLDMTPINTRSTDIDEVLILRGKRMASNVRSRFARSDVRRAEREWYEKYLRDHPVRSEVILRFTNYIRALVEPTGIDADDAAARGYF